MQWGGGGRSHSALWGSMWYMCGVFHADFPVSEKHMWGLWFLGSILKKHHSSWLTLPWVHVWCPVHQAPRTLWLQCLFSDPITYSSLDFSCLDLIILNPLYLIISGTARPDMKLSGGSSAALQKDNLPHLCSWRGLVSKEWGRVMGMVQDWGKAAPPAPPVLQPHKSEKLCCVIDYLAVPGVQGDARWQVPTTPRRYWWWAPWHTLTRISMGGCFWEQSRAWLPWLVLSSAVTRWHGRVQQIGTKAGQPCATFLELPCSCFSVFLLLS